MAAANDAHDRFAPWEGLVAFRLFADRAVPTLTVPEQIAARLGDRILAGDMAPGARIAELGLAKEFSVSHGPVREALRILEREGLVTILPRRGAIVSELNATELRELLEIRAGLFEIVVRKLVAQPQADTLNMLQAGVDRLTQLAQVPDAGDAYAQTTYRLLMLCSRQCGNRRLQHLLTALSLQTLRYSKLGLASVERRERSASLWREAAKAFACGDVERMVTLTRQRIDESAQEAARLLDAKVAVGKLP